MKRTLIEIHMIQNHCPSNLNRDDLGAPKTCYFGGVLRSRISSQCIKRSIRTSDDFADLLGGIRTRRLAEQIQGQLQGKDIIKRAKDVLAKCGIKSGAKSASSDMLVYTTKNAIKAMADLLKDDTLSIDDLKEQFAGLIEKDVKVPDMALCGRMLETGEIKNTTVEAALQTAHAISTHEAIPEVDYYVAVDDIKGEDAGAGYLDEAIYSSSCFYKYFSIDLEQLVHNLGGDEKLAAKTIGAFIYASARTNPSGKQNSYGAHNYPEGILVEIKDRPFNYANAFVKPVSPVKDSDLVTQSIGQLANYINDVNVGYGSVETKQLWFSPNGRHPLQTAKGDQLGELVITLDDLVEKVVGMTGHNWQDVQNIKVIEEA
jgi:CRISPR system Cascade subunit CasC